MRLSLPVVLGIDELVDENPMGGVLQQNDGLAETLDPVVQAGEYRPSLSAAPMIVTDPFVPGRSPRR